MNTVPRHVALIMDGNGRWARNRSLPRAEGHRQGVEALRRAVRSAIEIGIEYLTIFSFSAENWSRPEEEISQLFGLFRRFVRQDVAELHTAGVRVRMIGERSGLTPDIVAMIDESERLTQGNSGLNLVIAFNYGSRQELALTARKLAEMAMEGLIDPKEINADLLDRSLFTKDIPDPDLLIRTSGEKRISNFLLWQAAYTEFVFIEENWPDFSHEIMMRAIGEFASRDRRFGGLKVSVV